MTANNGTLRVLLLSADSGACGLYRMVMPARAVAKETNQVEIYVAEGLLGRQHRDEEGKIVMDYLAPIDMDVVVFQRPMSDTLCAAIPLVKEQGCAVVIELDDDMAGVPVHNMAYQYIHPKLSKNSNYQFLLEACEQADWMTCATPALGDRYMPGRYTVVPNYVPQSLAYATLPDRTGKSAKDIVLGWSGSIAVHAYDLQDTGSGVLLAMQQTGCNFLVVGESSRIGNALGLAADPPETGWVELPDYPENLMKLDVGIVPLQDNRFNGAKSWLKGMEMAAVGIPFVASPRAEYVRLQEEHGIGTLARKPKEWHREIKRLVVEEGYRTDVAGRNRTLVQERLTIERNVGRWIEAWYTAREAAHRRTLYGATTAVGSKEHSGTT